jgi:hypothetical protein
VAGCSSSSRPRDTAAPVTVDPFSPSSEPPSTAPTGPAINFGTAAHWTFDLEDPSGDRTGGELTVGRFSSPAEAQSLPGGQTATSLPCQVDPERDVVAPAVLTVTNANDTLSQKLDVSFFAFDDRHPGTEEPILDAAPFYTSGPKCIGVTRFTFFNGQASIGLASTDALEPTRFVSISLYLVLHNFVTAKEPGGDESLLRHIGLVLYLGGNGDGAAPRLSSFRGPKNGELPRGWPFLSFADMAPKGVTVAEPIYRNRNMGCSKPYQLKAEAGRDILIETLSLGGTGSFEVVDASGKVLLRFGSSVDEAKSYSFVMPSSGRVTIQDDGKSSFFGCAVDMGVWYRYRA